MVTSQSVPFEVQVKFSFLLLKSHDRFLRNRIFYVTATGFEPAITWFLNEHSTI